MIDPKELEEFEAMVDRGRVGIGKVVLRTAAVRPIDGVLGMSTMLFPDEVVPAKEIRALPTGKARVTGPEIEKDMYRE
jgi:non-homologous end joining protein Ku